MKSIYIAFMALIIVLAMIVPVALPVSADPPASSYSAAASLPVPTYTLPGGQPYVGNLSASVTGSEYLSLVPYVSLNALASAADPVPTPVFTGNINTFQPNYLSLITPHLPVSAAP